MGMRIGTGETIRKIDRYCMDFLRIPGIVLMENAAVRVVENIDLNKFKSFVIVCGTGNNGGDGFAVGRHLMALGCTVKFFLLGSIGNMSDLCRSNYEILNNILKEGSPEISTLITDLIEESSDNVEKLEELREAVKSCDAVIDSIFGTGLTREVKGIFEKVIYIINGHSRYTVAVDVPSGLNSDDGRIMGCSIAAAKTVTFLMYKKGFLKYDSAKFIGEVIVQNIGIPEFVLDKFHKKDFFTDRESVKGNLKPREKFSHKGDFGRTAVIAGSIGFTGAAYLSTEAAVRCGAGLVTLCCEESIQPVLSSRITEAMTVSTVSSNFENIINKSSGIAIGPGLGSNEASLELLGRVLHLANCPVVIDADGLNVLQGNLKILKTAKFTPVLTPHPGEFSRLTGLPAEYIEDNRIETAREFAKEHGVVLLLKGYNTIITDGDTVYVNPTGSSAMASGGMGDTLTGITASFISQGLKPFEAAFSAAFIHGYCGDKLAETRFCVNASEILKELPTAINDIIH
jgi:hydroxyethylthiazole kinase-like uncharacterized protein yjeF